MSEKPVIFICHATTDNPIVDVLKSQIDNVFANGIKVFASSVPGVIKPGSDWLDEIKSNLEIARAVIVVVTPVSINRPWIWFEVGASWAKMEAGNKRIYPLCVPEINFNDLPAPLNSLQALSLGKAKDVKLFFQELCDEFGFGNMRGFKSSTIIARIPKYSDLSINQTDLKAGAIYSGPYEGYNDSELEEVLAESFIFKSYSDFRGHRPGFGSDPTIDQLFQSSPIVPVPKSIFDGQLVHYRELDAKLQLPPGTSKRLLKSVARQFGLIPNHAKDFENSVRFEYKPEFDSFRDKYSE